MNRREELIHTARHYIQSKGYNGFSYADLAEDVGIRKASIHHHFSTKGDPGKALALAYHQEFAIALEGIVASEYPITCSWWTLKTHQESPGYS